MLKNVLVTRTSRNVNAEIRLTGSKSESNRALIIAALSNGKIKVNNLSEAADTVILEQALTALPNDPGKVIQINIGPAGTAMRFLTAYLALKPGNYKLTGSERMQQRPIGLLVDALRSLGANINYTEKEGYPPLNITGGINQLNNQITINGNISSQFISALLLIASSLPTGLELTIAGGLTSRPYVEMTLAMLEQAGIQHTWHEDKIAIEAQAQTSAELYIEPDWSAASYWYSIAALADEAELFLPGLNKYSLQGDSQITELMANFGITSIFENNGVRLKKETKTTTYKRYDLRSCPDLAQTLIVCCAARKQNATFTGLETLKIKETDRILALQTELAKIGAKLTEDELDYQLDCSAVHFPEVLHISTYEDHRMAMAFAPLALLADQLIIEDMDVVNKSYPEFWTHLKQAGFEVKEI